MNRTAFIRYSFLVATSLLTVPAWADISGTVTLNATINLDLEAGTTAASGGDLQWTGASLVPQGAARVANIGNLGVNGFETQVESVVRGFLALQSANPIATANLPVGQFLAVRTRTNKVAKMVVTAKNGTSITFMYVTFGAGAVGGAPAVTEILNNSSGTPVGLPNYGVAPSSIFVIKGTNLADAAELVLQRSDGQGIPLTLNGTSISVTVNGTTTRPAIYYTSPTQVAAVLPASTPVGTGTLTVTHGGVTSAPATIQVLAAAVGINSYNGSWGVATDAITGALLTPTAPGHPGQIIVLWTTGLGSDPQDSDSIYTLTPHAVNTALEIYIGGVRATILYQGSAGYPGVNQINLTIPANVPSGCSVPVVAVTGTVVSNTVVLPLRSGAGVCVDAVTGYTGTQLSQNGLRAGFVSLIRAERPGNSNNRLIENGANASFQRYTDLNGTGQTVVTPGTCVASPSVTGNSQVSFTGLDPGIVTLKGAPGGDVVLPSQGIKGAYGAVLTQAAIPTTGGSYQFQSNGGPDVGAFNVNINLSNPLISWTNSAQAATVSKSQGLRVTWTGGNPGTYVFITGTAVSAASAQSPTGVGGGFTCLARVEDREFTVPAYILLALPSGKGATEIQNDVYVPFTATGIDIGLGLGGVYYTVDSMYTN